jgi:sulfur carrier protein
MTKFKYFLLNGQKYCTYHDLTLLELITYFNYNTSLFVLEYNQLVWNQKNWSNTFIENNDKIEIVSIVGGG